jgi:hypothetical protein
MTRLKSHIPDPNAGVPTKFHGTKRIMKGLLILLVLFGISHPANAQVLYKIHEKIYCGLLSFVHYSRHKSYSILDATVYPTDFRSLADPAFKNKFLETVSNEIFNYCTSIDKNFALANNT